MCGPLTYLPGLITVEDFSLRSIAADDWPLEVALSRDADVIRWTLHPPNLDESAARTRCERSVTAAHEGTLHRYVIVSDGAPIGITGVGIGPEAAPEIFYAQLPQGRGRGFATRAALAVTGILLLHHRQVLLITLPGNTRSEAVARRSGFKPAGQTDRQQRGQLTTMNRWIRTTI